MTVDPSPAHRGPGRSGRRRSRRGRLVAAFLAVAALAAVQVYAFVQGVRLSRADPLIKLGAGPLVGSWDVRFGLLSLPAAAIGAASAMALPRLARQASELVAIAVTAIAGTIFALLLAAADGWQAVVAPARDPTEFWIGVAHAKPAGAYLRDFVTDQPAYSIHVQGHPPGFTLILLGARAVGLGSAWFVVVLSLLGVCLAVVAVAVTTRRLFGASALRAALPFLVLAPYTVWQVTSADAFYSGVAASGIALLVVAMTTTRPRVELIAAGAGGLVLGTCCFLTFGLPSLAPLVAVIAWHRRSFRWLAPAALGALIPFVIMWALGYWWLDGLQSTRRLYAISAASHRPYGYFLVANIAVLCIALGPAVLVGIYRLADNRAALVAAGGLACALFADLTGLSKAETERIWLLYMPWIAVGAASAARTERQQRWLLAVQVAGSIAIQSTLVSHW